MSQVVLIRPGATLYDEEKRIQGVLDVPLSERGRSEVAQMAENLARALAAAPARALYCGPGEPVVSTAEMVGRVLGLRPKVIEDLHNLNQGLWQGLQIEEIKRRNTRLFRQWLDDPETICPPCGEPWEAARERICGALKPLLRRHRNETMAVVLGEPLARLAACILRCESRVQLDELVPGVGFETIETTPLTARNGTH